MPNAKKLFTVKVASEKTVYGIVRREADGFFLNNADGAFAAAPANKNLAFSENPSVPGLYEVSESRAAWNDGRYKVFIYSFGSVSITPAATAIGLVGIAPTVAV